MKQDDFKRIMAEYTELMISLASVKGTIDWQSELWMRSTKQCADFASKHIDPGSRVLDFGCGMGLISVLMREAGYEVTGIDIDVGKQYGTVKKSYSAPWGTIGDELENPELLQNAWHLLEQRYGIKYGAFDGRNIPFEDDSFDAVIAHAVFEHINPDILPDVIRDISRVTRNGGHFLIFRTPRKKAWIEGLIRILRLSGHDLLYSEDEVEDHVLPFGFELESKAVTDMLPSFPPFGIKIYNWLSPVLAHVERYLLKTPLKQYAHHLAMVFRKIDQ